MTTVPATLDSPEAPPTEAADTRLPKAAFAFYLVVGAAALAAAGPRLEDLTQRAPRLARASSCSRRAPRSRSCSSSSLRGGAGNSEGTLSYHTTGVFLLPAALLLAPPLAALVPVVQHLPEWLKKRQPWYIATFNIFNYTLTVLAALAVNRWVLERDGILSNAQRAHRRRRPRGLRRLRPREPRPARGDVPPRPQHLDPGVRAVRRRVGLGRVRPRGARRRRRVALELEPVADPARARADRSDQPLARGACAAAAGAHRPEDEPLQRAPLRRRARGRAVARRAVRPAALAADVRPRPAPRHQQRLRPSRRRRRASRGRRRLPRGAAPLRHPGALRRRGVLDPPARDGLGAGARDRRPDPALARGAPLPGRDVERADPRHDLDRRRGVPDRRDRRRGARPRGRPRRLPREAPGPEPRRRGRRRVEPADEAASAAARLGARPSRCSRSPQRASTRRSCRWRVPEAVVDVPAAHAAEPAARARPRRAADDARRRRRRGRRRRGRPARRSATTCSGSS